MDLPSLQTWVGGAPEPSEVRDGGVLADPNTGRTLLETLSSSPDQVDRAIAAADAAHSSGDWAELGAVGRAPFLRRLAKELDRIADRVAVLDSLNSGVPIRVTSLFAGSNGDTIREAMRLALERGDRESVGDEGREVTIERIPWGATALILPWNAPAAMAVKKLGYALAAGATVVVKPSPASPLSAQLIMAAVARAGLPNGVVSLVLGGAAVGEQLVSDRRIRVISMTGSTPTGRAIAALAAPNLTRLRLELGSSNPAIVRADANLPASAAAIVAGAMKLSGQWCEAPRRVIVARERMDGFVAVLRSKLGALRHGSSLDRASDLGPVAFEGRLRELTAQREALREQGATIIESGTPPKAGWFMAPTIAVSEEIDPRPERFGPIITVQPSDDDEHALALANDGQVGLAGYVFSADTAAAAALGRRLVAGEVKINGTSVLDLVSGSRQSFFGSAGLGGHGDADLLDFFVGSRIVGADAPGLPL